MASSSKKQNFLHGATLLAAATAIVKLIGAFYKIPLKRIIGDLGYGYFITAYDIYSVLLMIATAGLPIAMSRMISQANSLGKYGQVRRVYKTARTIFLIIGLLSSLLMLIFCRELAAWQKQPGAVTAIACLAPCAFLMGIISTFRGFFQGQENMRPTSVSQVLEAFFKLGVGLVLAYILMKKTGSDALAAGGAIFGVTFSCLISVLYLYSKFRPAYRELPETDEEVLSAGATAKQLLAIAVPITIGSAGLYLMTVIETGVYMDRIVDLIATDRYTLPLVEILKNSILEENPNIAASDLHSQIATNMKGIYNFAQTIFNMPGAFIIPITTSILPAITAQLTRKQHEDVRATEESAARITGLLSLPCTVGLCLLAGPVMSLLGGYSGDRLELAKPLMFLLAAGIFPYAVVQYTNVILQSHGKATIPVIHMLLAGAVRLLLVYLFAGNPSLGIIGVPIGGLICNCAIAVLNLIAIRRIVPQKPKLLRNLLRPILPTALMGLAVFGTYKGILLLLGEDCSRIVLCGGPIAVGVIVYLIFAVVCKSITRDDCLLLPKGEKLAKLLKL